MSPHNHSRGLRNFANVQVVSYILHETELYALTDQVHRLTHSDVLRDVPWVGKAMKIWRHQLTVVWMVIQDGDICTVLARVCGRGGESATCEGELLQVVLSAFPVFHNTVQSHWVCQLGLWLHRTFKNVPGNRENVFATRRLGLGFFRCLSSVTEIHWLLPCFEAQNLISRDGNVENMVSSY